MRWQVIDASSYRMLSIYNIFREAGASVIIKQTVSTSTFRTTTLTCSENIRSNTWQHAQRQNAEHHTTQFISIET